jgi:hypothetical protein
MRQRYGPPSHFRESIREEGVGRSMACCFIYVLFLIIHAITNMIYNKRDFSYSIGTKFADFLRHNMRLQIRFRILFGEPFVFMHREAILTVGGRR